MTRTGKAISKNSVRRARWIRIIVIALFVFAVSMFAMRLHHANLEQLSGLSTTDFFLSWCVISALVIVVAGVGWRRGQFGWRHFWAYPPYWFAISAGVVAAVLLYASQIHTSNLDARLLWDGLTFAAWGALIVLTSFVVFCAVVRMRPSPPANAPVKVPDSASQTSAKTSVETLETPAFLRWITSDSPVRTPQYDLFEHSVIAQRMFTRLGGGMGGRSHRIPSQAVIGPVGCGKSTIGSLLASQIATQAHDSMIFVRAELWPYETARAAAEGILSSIVGGLGREVSVIDIKGLPKQYGELIARATGGINWLPSLFALGPKTPIEAIASIDKIALAINRRIVLWIEDLERFAPTLPGVENGAEVERLAPIRALLYGLGKLQMVSVIVASTDLSYQFDLEKIADFVERVSVNRDDVATVLQRFRAEALSTDDVIKTYNEHERRLDWVKPDANAAMQPNDMLRFGQAVAHLTLLPRTLKSGLRNALDAWNTLRGEIDPDEVMALSLIKVAHPRIFAMIDRHIGSLRNERRHRMQIDETDFMAELDRDPANEMTKQAIALIVDRMLVTHQSAQGIGARGTTDYWQRFLSPVPVVVSSSDQVVLRLLATGDGNALADGFEDPRQAGQLKQFAGQLATMQGTSRVLQSLDVIVARRMKEGTAAWPQVGPSGLPRAHGIFAVAQILRAASGVGSANPELLHRVSTAIATATPVNLVLVHELLRSFGPPGQVPESALQQRGYELIAAYYGNRPAELAQQLGTAPPQLLRWLFVVMAKEHIGLPSPLPGWSAMAASILAALELDPATMAPAIAHLVTRSYQAYDDESMKFQEVWEFDESLATDLFGDASEFLVGFKHAVSRSEMASSSAGAFQLTAGGSVVDCVLAAVAVESSLTVS